MSEAIIVVCPKCGAEQEDFDGFGVLYCPMCLYCQHPHRDGNSLGQMVCGICGDIELKIEPEPFQDEATP